MSEMVERLARQLSPMSWEALNTKCDTKAKKERRKASMDYARKCIEAMREPKLAMCMAGSIKAGETSPHEIGVGTVEQCELIWQAMIDEALKG